MNELQQLEAKIRQALPRLKELSIGCIIGGNPTKYKVLSINEVGLLILNLDALTAFTIPKLEPFGIPIIGHEIYLTDVLEWVFKAEPRSYIKYTIDNKFIINGHTYDLSKPLLKDQPKEVIEYLNQLK